MAVKISIFFQMHKKLNFIIFAAGLVEAFIGKGNMKHIGKDTFIGYSAGIATGVTYGLNPLFAVPLIRNGASVEAILFFRYLLSVLLLGAFLLLRRESFRVTGRQLIVLFTLGVLFTCSSIFLFDAYRFIASGLATTLVYLYPAVVALIMVFLKVFTSWQVWLSIIVTFTGVLVMTRSDATHAVRIEGIVLAIVSAVAYALFIVIINRSKRIKGISNSLLTFYALCVGAVIFFIRIQTAGIETYSGLNSFPAWLNIIGLAVFPTIISTSTLALSTRKIGAAKTSVLGVFEPVTAILVGALVFREALTANILLGIILSVAAVTFMIVSSRKG